MHLTTHPIRASSIFVWGGWGHCCIGQAMGSQGAQRGCWTASRLRGGSISCHKPITSSKPNMPYSPSLGLGSPAPTGLPFSTATQINSQTTSFPLSADLEKWRPHRLTYPEHHTPPPLAHARPCLSTGWALNRRFEGVLGRLFLWSRMEDWVFVEHLYRERGAQSCL